MHGSNDEFKKAILAAEAERDELNEQLKKYDKMRSRINQLELFIRSGRELLGEEQALEKIPQESMFPEPEAVSASLPEGTQIKSIIKIIRDAGRPLCNQEIVDEFRKRNWTLSENNGSEVIRNVLKKNESLFEKQLKKEGRFLRMYYGLKATDSSEVSTTFAA